MANEPDIFALLESVYGDETSAREAKIDSAVQTIERTQRVAYDGMRQFTETGKIATPKVDTAELLLEAMMVGEPEPGMDPDANTRVEKAPVDPDAKTQIMAPLDPEQTEIVRRAPRKPAAKAKAATPPPPPPAAAPAPRSQPGAIVSGAGADFHDPSGTKTQIVVRRKKGWFR